MSAVKLTVESNSRYLNLQPGSSLDHLQAASITYRIAIGPHRGCRLHAMSINSVFGRLLPKKVLKITPIEYTLTGSNRRSIPNVGFIPFR
jgi:hypothetical protein